MFRLPSQLRVTPGGYHLDGLTLLIRLDMEGLFFSMAGTDFRSYYNDFTTIDWAKAYTVTNRFNYGLKESRLYGDDGRVSVPMPWWLKTYYTCGKWVLIVMILLVFSLIAYFIDKFEILLVGVKYGYCRSNWFASQVTCCNLQEQVGCDQWVLWQEVVKALPWIPTGVRIDYIIYVVLLIGLAWLACEITLTTRIVGGSTLAPENGDCDPQYNPYDDDDKTPPPRVMYTLCGLGVPEVKTILSGFVIRRFLGAYTLLTKTMGLVLAIALGMSLGKEGPYVHLATCVGNISMRLFPYINRNDLHRKQILSAAALAGVALAFGSPLGGVLFILEEINHYLPSHQLFLVFFCAIISTLFLKFLNPYGTGQTVLFELKYDSDWRAPELLFFVIIGVAGGLFGAAFIKFVFWWPTKFRQLKMIKNHPAFEVICVALVTGIITYWNIYTKQALLELVLDLATPCSGERDRSLCPATESELKGELALLGAAFVIKIFLTFITFGLKLPCGIYVPLMVAGALFGRIFSMAIQWANLRYNLLATLLTLASASAIMRYVCLPDKPECVDMGIYAMILAGAFMAGVTRMNITLVTILFELTSSYTYVLPISIAISVANWAGGLIETHLLYERLLIANDYPFMTLENDAVDPFVTVGEVITDRDTVDHSLEVVGHDHNHGFRRLLVITLLATNTDDKLYIDVSELPVVLVLFLELKLALLADHHLLDGCLPLVRGGLCVGLIHFSELEYCLDRILSFTAEHHITEEIHCQLVDDDKFYHKNRAIVARQLKNNEEIIELLVEEPNADYFSYGAAHVDSRHSKLRDDLDAITNVIPYVEHNPIFLNHDLEMSLANLIFDRIGNRVLVLQREGKYYGVLHKKVLIDYTRRGADDIDNP